MAKLLIIDDDEDIRMIGRMGLERLGGWQVVEATDGLRALEVARAERPDAILLDVMMPGRDGPETLAALRADAELATIPVIFLTAKVQSHERQAYLAQGAVGVIRKPFDPVELPAQVRAILDAAPD